MKIRILKENKKDCFQEKDFEAKSNCVQKQKGIPKDNSDPYVASVLRNKGELKEVEELGETSAVTGGGIVGYTKGKEELEELFSSSAAKGGIKLRITFGNKEHSGHVERSKYQGLKNVMEADDNPSEPLISFAINPRNQRHLKNIVNQIFESYELADLSKAIVMDNTSEDRINFISKNIPESAPNMSKEVASGNEDAIKDYYYFLATEYLYWTLNNPRAHPARKGVGIFEMTDEIRNYVMAHIDRYAHPKYGKSSKHNPKSLSQSTIGPDSPSQKDYGETGGLNPFLYKLPE